MDSAVVTLTEEGFLSLASLRLLVPPLQLLSVWMWQILKKRDVMSFWKVSEFVSLVMETVPELLLSKHWTQLTFGLRARFILELCQRGDDKEIIMSHVENMKPQQSALHKDSFEEKTGDHFAELIYALLKDNHQRQIFFQELWCEEYGPQFDSDLQMLFWEFLSRLNQLLPVPELEQTVLWLGDSSVMEDFLQCISEPTPLRNLVHHHKHLGHLEQHVPPSRMGDRILSSLCAASKNRRSKPEANLRTDSNLLIESNGDMQPTSFVEGVAMEIFTVTECTELTSTTNLQVVVIDDTCPNKQIGEETMMTLPEQFANPVKESEAVEEKIASADVENETQVPASTAFEVGFMDSETSNKAMAEETVIALNKNVTKDESKAMEKIASAILKDRSQFTDNKRTVKPHNCLDCGKKFKFASFLVAHRVIHTGERPHKCPECGQCFSFRQSLERHRQRHKMRKNFECPTCHKCFPSSVALSVHKQTCTKKGVYSCQERSTKCTQELALARHMKTHMAINGNKDLDEVNGQQETILTRQITSKPVEEQGKEAESEFKTNRVIDMQLVNKVISLVQVRTSQRKCRTMKKLERQKEAEKVKNSSMKLVQLKKSCDHSYGTSMTPSNKVHKGAVTKDASYSCPYCGYLHTEETLIQQHIKEWHSNKRKITELTAEKEEEDSYKTLYNFKCSVCGELSKCSKDHKDHMTSTHMQNGLYFCSGCGKNYTWRAAFIRHIRMYCSEGSTNSFACPYCELAFDCARSLSSHVKSRHEERVHTCNCGKGFVNKASLTAHQRTHQKERPHVCHQCGKGFLYRGGLLGHLKIHSLEMPFACSHCGKGFKRELSMRKHERCHTREKVFECSQCDKSFVYKATLTRHKLTHTGERPYLCSDCGKCFFSHSELLKHERFHRGHKPFECPYCGKAFTQSCYLTLHLRYHTGAKPYACGDCDKSFLSANRLKRHQRTHTGEKPYVCGQCGKGFRQSYHLKLHQRTHLMDLT